MKLFLGTFPTSMGRPGGYAIDCNDDYAYITVEREGTEEEKRTHGEKCILTGK